MQDLPLSLPAGSQVGFTVINETWAAYSPVKNSPQEALKKVRDGCPSHSATAAEMDLFLSNCFAIKAVSPASDLAAPYPAAFNGLDVEVHPRVVWSPSFALTVSQLAGRVRGPLRLTSKATMVLEGDITLEGPLSLDGALRVRALDGSRVVVGRSSIRNDGWVLHPCGADEPVQEENVLRGFKLVVEDTQDLSFDDGLEHRVEGDMVREGQTLSTSPLADNILTGAIDAGPCPLPLRLRV